LTPSQDSAASHASAAIRQMLVRFASDGQAGPLPEHWSG
jgi:hypothetical protein